MNINPELLENKIMDIDGKLEEIKALNEVITEFIEDVQDMNKNSINLLRNKAYKVIYFANMIHDKSKEISNEINNLIPCQ